METSQPIPSSTEGVRIDGGTRRATKNALAIREIGAYRGHSNVHGYGEEDARQKDEHYKLLGIADHLKILQRVVRAERAYLYGTPSEAAAASRARISKHQANEAAVEARRAAMAQRGRKCT